MVNCIRRRNRPLKKGKIMVDALKLFFEIFWLFIWRNKMTSKGRKVSELFKYQRMEIILKLNFD